ncbi:MAG: transporter [Acidiferrobacterales bacterium]
MNPPRKWCTRYRLAAVIAAGAVGWSSAVSSAPITFNTALPVAKGEFVFREQLVVNQSGDDPSGADRDRTSQAAVSVLGYGINSKFAVFGVLPYLDNELKITTGGQRVTRSTSGFGDLSMFGRYTVVQRDRPGRNFRVAPFFGIKAPTGEDDASDALGLLPSSVQVGSGSWDPFVGVVATYQTLRYQVDSQFSFRANNEANNFEAGDIARLDGSLQYRLYPRKLAGGVPGFLYGVIEANLIHQDNDRVGGIEDPNSGGMRLFLTPGIQYVTKRWIVEGAVQIPISQDLNGTALENDFVARVSVRLNL